MSDGRHSRSVAEGAVDFGKHSDDYSKYRPGLPDHWYSKLDALIEQTHGTSDKERTLNILDLGCGPGTIAFELLRRYSKCQMTCVDISENQIKAAERKLDTQYAQRCRFFVASADELRQIEQIAPHSMDVVVCGQCWPWFDAQRTLSEVSRVLRRGSGLLVIAQYCYLPRLSEVARLTEQLIVSERYNPRWTHSDFDGLYPTQIEQIVSAKHFDFDWLICYDYDETFSLFSWIKRVDTCNGVHELSEQQLDVFNDELERRLRTYFIEKQECVPDTFAVKHRIWTVIAKVTDTRAML